MAFVEAINARRAALLDERGFEARNRKAAELGNHCVGVFHQKEDQEPRFGCFLCSAIAMKNSSSRLKHCL